MKNRSSQWSRRSARTFVAAVVGIGLSVGLYTQVASGSQSPREQFCTVASNSNQYTEETRGRDDIAPGRFIADVRRSLESVQGTEFRGVAERADVLLQYVTAFEARDKEAMSRLADAARDAQSELNTVAREECGVDPAF